ncbi:carboxyl-terminal processing protease [Pseudoalteromonas citrea]|uniref:Carboxyl-terminal processing protease n=2 Tax=Pseudoalteromonas citrea TaxID=43655 RepID=A0AAD4AJD3_9GAMM|nr:S41 family peptidase [Pseudoalteromonas citrea]KAF7772050.1 carboxyl-terminal processing protease [Pseudoalteromonas citrea]
MIKTHTFVTQVQHAFNQWRVFCFGILLALTLQTQSANATAQFDSEQINEIVYHIHTYYVEDIPLSNIQSSNIDTLFEQLDAYSKYLSEHELDAIFSAANGRYTGIGIEVERVDNRIVIVNTLPGSPAAQAGIEGGDKLVAIGSDDVTSKDIEHVSKLLRAAEFATINITVERAKTNVTLALRRQEINLESVNSKLLKSGNGYIELNSFNNHSYHDISRHINKLISKNGSPLAGLVLDLRDNPGGTLSSAVAISDLFLQAGTIVTTKGRFFDANQRFTAQSGDILNGAPIVVLINEQSASAAEILAGALQDNERALIIGKQSYGKGSVQSLIPLGNGTTALKLTTARYFTPSGQSIEGVGIKPDVIITPQNLSNLDKTVIMTDEQTTNLAILAKLDSHIVTAKKLLKK